MDENRVLLVAFLEWLWKNGIELHVPNPYGDDCSSAPMENPELAQEFLEYFEALKLSSNSSSNK